MTHVGAVLAYNSLSWHGDIKRFTFFRLFFSYCFYLYVISPSID